jgi:hypothetical protein
MNHGHAARGTWSDGLLVYWVDDKQRISIVGSEWDHFALENNAPHLTSAHVFGQPLWKYITDDTTRMLYEALIARAVDGRAVRFSLRCDSPAQRRRLEMEICTERGFVRFQTQLIAAQPRNNVLAWTHQTGTHSRAICVCGWCNRVESSQGWTEVEDAIKTDALFELAPPAAIYVTCPRCLDTLEEEVLSRG